MFVGLIVRLFAICGVSLAPVWAGVIIAGAIGAAFTAYSVKLYDAGYASADKKAEIANLESQLAAAKMDASNAHAAAGDAALRAASIETQAQSEKERTDAYVHELESRPPVTKVEGVACPPSDLLDQRDINGMRGDGEGNVEPRPARKTRVHGPRRRPAFKAE